MSLSTGKAESVSAGQEVPILMPAAGNTMETGTILAWRVREGDWIDVGQVLCEIETDKAVIEYESPTAGQVLRLVATTGDVVAVKEPIAFLHATNGDVREAVGSEPSVTAVPNRSNESEPRVTTASPMNAGHSGDRPTVRVESRVVASPSVRRRARELDIDLESLGRGSGPGGRIILSDLTAVIARDQVVLNAQLPPPPDGASAKRYSLSKMRKTIATRLVQSKQSIPHFYIRSTVIVDKLWSLHVAKSEAECTFNDWIVLACGRALAEFPVLRSQLEGDEIIEHGEANIGIAVAVDEGLLVPVIKRVDKLSLSQLAEATRRVIDDARRGVIANMGQGVFTISNLGMYGIDEFSAIINPPESAILAVGSAREQVIVKNGALRPGRTMTLTLSADHRLVDGATAAKFLAKVRQLLELEIEGWWR